MKSYTKTFLLGTRPTYNKTENIYLSPPKWSCGWYWGFGYLGNKDCHYHLSGLMNNENLFEGLKKEFGDSLTIPKENIWTFCELVKTAYSLKEAAEILGRGGANYTKNPCEDIIKNTDEVRRINEVVLPAIFDEIEKCFE